MRPLTACMNCGRNLPLEMKIINEARQRLLVDAPIDKILNGEVEFNIADIFDDLHLQLCCRNIINTHRDLTSKIYT
jgi:DNA-directed RNA polymerase subunit N (RpoN/RPB10)